MPVKYSVSLNGQYNANPSALKDGEFTAAQVDQFGRFIVSIQESATGVSTSANQIAANASLASINSKLTSPINVLGPLTDTQLRATPITVTGPLTDAQLRASAVPVSGTFFPATQPISVVSLPLPTGAATEATLNTRASQATVASILAALSTLATITNQTTGNSTLASILAALAPIATASNQSTTNTSLSSIDSKLTQPSIGVITSVAQNPAQVTLLAANANRKGLYLYNDASAKVFVSFAPTASATVFSMQLNSQTGYESAQTNCYKGIITAIWNSGTTGFMRITELT